MDRKNNCNHRHQKNHGNGFILGVIVGVILTLLFTTKKGREIVKELTEKGLDKLSDLQGVMDEAKTNVKEAASNAVAAASDLEEELVELVEEGSEGDYIAEIGTDPGSVAADSFGSSDTEATEKSTEPQKTKEEKKHNDHKEHKAASVHKESEPKSNGEAKGTKRFFLRRVSKS